MTGECEPLLGSLVGGNFNGLAIGLPPGGLVCMHMTLSMVVGVSKKVTS